jgi:diguanylate cyclase (GGDEF)-like protein/PAS domain S-box-containing protein
MVFKKDSQKNRVLSAADERTFNLMFERHSAVMLLIEPQTGVILDANHAAVNFYGYPKSKLCGMAMSEINALSPKQVGIEYQKVLSEEQKFFTLPQILANGEERIVEVYSSPFPLRDGEALLSIVHDVTERKQVEEILSRRTEELTSLQTTILDISLPHSITELLSLIVERAANLLGASSGGLYLTEPEQRRVRCVVSYRTSEDFTGTLLDFGVGAAGYVAETGKPLIIDDYRKWSGRAVVYEEKHPFQAVMSAPMLWQGRVSGVIHVLRDDGSKKFTQEELNLLLLFANHAAVAVENARLFELLNKELTERKQMEELLEKTQKNYEMFFNSIDDFLFVLDERGHIIHTNDTVKKRLGYSEGELFGESVLIVHPPERREEAGRIVGEMLAGAAEFCPVPIMTKSGEQIPVETRVTSGLWNDRPAIFGVTKDMSQVNLSEEKFSRAFQSSSALMALSYFEDGTYIDVNEVFLKTLGYSRDEVIGKKSTELHIFADATQRERLIEKIKRDKTVKDMDVLVQTKDGSLRDGLFSADTIYIGKDLCLLSVMVDITERKRVEEALRESQSLYHSLVEISPLSICRKDLAGRFTFANRRFLELSQTTLAELVGKTDFDLHPSELAEKYRRDDQAIIDSGKVQELIEERAILDGETVVVQSIKTPIYDWDGKVNGIQVSFWDITERKRMEQALRASEEKYRMVANFTYDWEAWHAPDGSYLYISPSCERISGYTAAQFLSDPSLVVEIAHSDDRVKVAEHFDLVFHHHSEQDMRLDFRIIRADGETRWIDHHCTAVYGENGDHLGRRESNRDITDRKRAEEKLRQQNQYFSVLYQIMLDLLNHRNVDELFQMIVDHTAVLLDAPFVELMLEQGGELVVQTFTQNQPFLKGEHCDRESARLSWQAFDTKQPAVLNDYSVFPYRQDIYEKCNLHAVADFPILIGDKCMGILALGRSQPGYIFDEMQVKNGMLFAQLAALVLDNARLFANLEREIAERKQVERELEIQRDFATQIINNMGQGLTVTNAEGRFEYVNPAYARLFGYKSEELIGKSPADVTVSQDQKTLEKQIAQRREGKISTYESRLSRPDGSMAHVLITGVPRERDGQYDGSIAVITDLTEQKRIEDELRRAKVELELTNQKLEQALVRERQLSRTDSLTGINNRGALFELATLKFNVAMRYRIPFSVILFDVDYFKQINDTFGHAVGDRALQYITQVVCGQIRSADVIGRYGGDEFMILLPQSSAREAARLAERIHANISEIRIETEKGSLPLTISLGIAQAIYGNRYDMQDDTLEKLFVRVDQALYAAKQAGRNRTMLLD